MPPMAAKLLPSLYTFFLFSSPKLPVMPPAVLPPARRRFRPMAGNPDGRLPPERRARRWPNRRAAGIYKVTPLRAFSPEPRALSCAAPSRRFARVSRRARHLPWTAHSVQMWMLKDGERSKKRPEWVRWYKVVEPEQEPPHGVAWPHAINGQHLLTTRASGGARVSLHACCMSKMRKKHGGFVRTKGSPSIGLYDDCYFLRTFLYVETTEPLAFYRCSTTTVTSSGRSSMSRPRSLWRSIDAVTTTLATVRSGIGGLILGNDGGS